MWILVLIAIIAVGGVALWFLLADDGAPTATFDGEAATYSGPTSIDAGAITFTLDASAYDSDVAFVLTEVADPDMTMADIEAFSATYSAMTGAPDWAGQFYITFVGANDVRDHDFNLTDGTWLVSANTSPSTTDRVYPAELIEVGG